MQQKVERAQIWQLVTLDFTLDHAAEVLSDALACNPLRQQLVPLWPQSDQPDIGRVALVTRSRVGNVDKPHFHWIISTEVRTTDLSISAGQ